MGDFEQFTKRIKTISDRVRWVLVHTEKARNSDEVLFECYREFFGEIKSHESIRRCRQKLQADAKEEIEKPYPEAWAGNLLPTELEVIKARQVNEKHYEQYFRKRKHEQEAKDAETFM